MRLSNLEGKRKETIMAHHMDGDSGQAALWNGRVGENWVEAQDLLDEMLKPLEERLLESLLPEPGEQALDVGCGTGGTTLAVARRLSATGHCLGVDVSQLMLAAARARVQGEGAPASFICADAQTYAFEPARFDCVFSRFGVMFFNDPVRAFANLRRAAKRGARLRFVAWRRAAENPFMTTAESVAAPLLPNLPARDPDAPGQFAFGDQSRVARILEESGWAEITIAPIDVVCTLPESSLVHYLTRLGPLGQIFPETDEKTRARVIAAVRAAFEPYVHGAEVRFEAACWMVGAQTP